MDIEQLFFFFFCGEKDLEQLYSLLRIRIIQTPFKKGLNKQFSRKHYGFYLKQNTNIQNILKISTHYYLYVNISLKVDIAIAH